MDVTIENLLEDRFCNRTLDTKIQILSGGKPRPNLSLSAILTNEEGVGMTIYFDPELYDQVQWLTGSEKLQCLFCWPCLLTSSVGVWAKSGVSDILHLPQAISEHEKTAEHVQAMLEYQLFIVQNGVIAQTSAIKLHDVLRNDIVIRNRELIKRMTDVVCSVVMKEQIFRNKNKGCNQIKADDCITVMQLIKNYDTKNVNQIDDIIDLIRIQPNILNDLVDAVSKVIKLAIKEESQLSSYVSFILSEHSDVTWQSQLSTILRYIIDGKVRERFTGFSNIRASKSVDVIFEHIKSVVSQFNMGDRWIAHAFDGGMLPASDMLVLLYKLKTVHSRAVLVPCHHHDLYSVLKDSFSHIKECTLFFKTMSSIGIFFQNNPMLWRSFELFLPAFRNINWYEQSQIIKMVKNNRMHFLKFFQLVSNSCKEWDADNIARASGFYKFLQDLQTVFFLNLFDLLLESITGLSEALKSGAPETSFNNMSIDKLKNHIVNVRDTGFQTLWFGANMEVRRDQRELPEQPKRRKIEIDDQDTMLRYNQIHNKIIDRMIQDIELRFDNLNQLEFCNLLNNGERLDVPTTISCIKKLMEFQGPSFDEEQICNEITVFRSNSEMFAGKNIDELFKLFNEANLQHTFKNLYRLSELILTMPFKPIELEEGGAAKLKDIKNWSYIPENVNVPGDVSLMCVEFDFLQELKKDASFYSDVANQFYELNKTMELE